MTLDQITMPDAVRSQVNSILVEIADAEGVLELSRLGGITEGFSMGLGCSGAMAVSEVDALEMIFTQAIGRRMADLRHA
jgi:hypothetical protein